VRRFNRTEALRPSAQPRQRGRRHVGQRHNSLARGPRR
jgi:hypothetical protein